VFQNPLLFLYETVGNKLNKQTTNEKNTQQKLHQRVLNKVDYLLISKKAIAEYIWNGFDANASIIELDFDANAVGYINSFSISVNGSGINLGRIEDTFGQFMDSQKTKTFDQTGFVKGKAGKGHFSFTNFCSKAIWETTFESYKSDFLKYNIPPLARASCSCQKNS